VVALSLAAALCFAAASVLQHQAASSTPPGRGGGVGLLVHLLGRPRWLAGIAADGVGYLLQVIALDHGPLAIVQPLLAVGLLFALLFNVSHHGHGMRRKDWAAAATTAAGLAIFVVVGAPNGNAQGPDDPAWTGFTLVTAVLAVAIAGLASRRPPAQKAALLAGAAGITYGLSAALTKQSIALFHQGVGHLLLTSYPYALVAASVAGMVLTQSAFHAGPLAASLPTLTLTEPIFATIAGVVLFGERLRGGLPGAIALAGAAAAGVAVVVLTQSPSAQPLLRAVADP